MDGEVVAALLSMPLVELPSDQRRAYWNEWLSLLPGCQELNEKRKGG